jgi:hypothetical protein
VIFFARSSNDPAQPTKNRYSASGFSEMCGMPSPLGPLVALVGVHAPGVALRLHALERTRELGREPRLFLDEVAAHVDDLVDVLDVHRACFLARAARRARPDHLVGDAGVLADHALRLCAIAHRSGLVVVEEVAEIEQHLARRERLARRGGRAFRRAAAALRARVHVEHLLPREVRQLRRSVDLGVLEVLLREPAVRLELREEDVRDRGDDVKVLREREQV